MADWFGRFDLDGSGDLDMLEFEDALCSIGLALGSIEIDVLFKSLDTDHSGGLDIDEFTAMLKDNTSVRDFHEILKNATKEATLGSMIMFLFSPGERCCSVAVCTPATERVFPCFVLEPVPSLPGTQGDGPEDGVLR